MKEIVVDLFAGGGGASQGIKLALGHDPDIAINHDPVAIAMHAANHPGSTHYHEDIWKVHPMDATKGRPVGLLWASPDCKHFSRAKGGPPKRDKEIRALAWVVVKWAQQVKPRVIILENVEEFATWGPLDRNGKIIDRFNGFTFRTFVWQLERQGYRVEHRSLRACDYGAPTIRKRLFLIARCDGAPIAWPEPTHGPDRDFAYRTAAEIIDWSIPCPSIFERKRPLAENTMRRIAQGIKRYVIDAAEPFIVTCNHGGTLFRGQGVGEPMKTVTASRDAHGLVIPYLQTYYGPKRGGDFRGHSADEPVRTQTTENRFALVSTFLAKHFGVVGHEINRPAGTITTKDHHSLVTSNLIKLRGTCRDGQPVTEPMPTVTSGGLHIGEVRAFLMKYYGTKQDPNLQDPLHTITTKDRFGLVMVQIQGEPYVIADIGMRMLIPRELFRAQGFPDSYRIDIEVNGRKISKADQVRMCGNSVCPPVAQALVGANISDSRSAASGAHSL